MQEINEDCNDNDAPHNDVLLTDTPTRTLHTARMSASHTFARKNDHNFGLYGVKLDENCQSSRGGRANSDRQTAGAGQ